MKNKSIVLVLILFWIIYIGRMYVDLLLRGITAEAYNQDASFYFYYALIGCFIPCFCLVLQGWKIDFAKLNKWLTVSVLVSSATLICFIYSQVGLSFEMFAERMSFSIEGEGRVLGSGLISKMGVSLAVISVFNILSYKRNFILLTVALFTGIALTILGSTKGALINLGLILVILIIANLRLIANSFKLKVWIAALLIISLIYVPKFNPDNINIFSRFVWLNERLQTGDEMRLKAWKGGLTQFANNPIIGDQMFEHTMRGYPHNILVEVLMATGYIGFIPFVIILFAAFSKVIFVIKHDKEKSLIAYLFLSYFISALVSGGIYSIVEFWITLGAILSIKERASLRITRLTHENTNMKKF